MRASHTLPFPWPVGGTTGSPKWDLVLPAEAIASAAKGASVVIASMLLVPLALVLAVVGGLALWPAWVLTAPVLGTAWLADQLRPKSLVAT